MASVGWSEHAQASPARCPSSVVGYRLLSTDNAAPLLSAEAVAPMVLYDYLDYGNGFKIRLLPATVSGAEPLELSPARRAAEGADSAEGGPSHCRSVPRARQFG